MHRFERDAIQFIVGESRLAPEIRRQLDHATVRERSADTDARITYFDIADGTPLVVPGQLEMAEDLDIDGYGVVTAHIAVANGRLFSLSFTMPGKHWPEHPRILGLAPEP